MIPSDADCIRACAAGQIAGLAALVYLAPAAVTWPRHTLTPHAYAAIAALSAICTALAFVVFFALIREVGATRALLFTYVNPAVALIAGVVFLREPLTWFHVAGLALILTGSVLASRVTSKDVADE